MKAAAIPSPGIKEYYGNYWQEGGFCPRGRMHSDLDRILAKTLGGRCGKLLDMGCGDAGTLGPWARRSGWDYLGVDISPGAVALAQKAGFEAKEIAPDFSTGLPPEEVDAVACLEVLEHLLNPELCVRECLRVMRPGGMLFATVPNAVFWRHRLDMMFLGRVNPNGDNLSLTEPWRDPHLRFFTGKTLARLMIKIGLKVIWQGGYGGGIVSSAPLIHRWSDPWKSSWAYRGMAAVWPTLFAAHLVGIFQKPYPSKTGRGKEAD